MLRADLIGRLVNGTDLTKGAADSFLLRLSFVIREAITKGQRVHVPGLGTFFVSKRRGRAAGDPNDPTKKIVVLDTTIPRFNASRSLKRAAKGSRKPYARDPKPERHPLEKP